VCSTFRAAVDGMVASDWFQNVKLIDGFVGATQW